MAFIRPTLTQLRNRSIAIVNERLAEANVDAGLRMSVLNILAAVMAEMANEELAYLDYIAKQATPYTASDEFLNAWGMVWNIHRKLASFATGRITVNGTPGAEIALGTEWSRADSAVYIVTESVTIPDSGIIDVLVKSNKVGLAYNAAAGVKMSLSSPISGLKSEAVVNKLGLTGGAEVEDDEAYKARILLRIQNPPAGGSKSDWVQWVLEVPGVTRAWCYPLEMGPGTVGIRFMMDDTYEDGIPHEGDVERVQQHLNEYERKPVTATVFVNAPIAHKVSITVKDLLPDSPEIREAIDAEMKYLFWNEAEPGSMVYVSKIWGAINSAAGVESFMLDKPMANTQMASGVMPFYGKINYGLGDENADG